MKHTLKLLLICFLVNNTFGQIKINGNVNFPTQKYKSEILDKTKQNIYYSYVYSPNTNEKAKTSLTILQIGQNYSKFTDVFLLKNDSLDKQFSLLKNIGININTLPVLDVRSKGSSAIIGDRAFSDNTKIVSEIGDICIKEFHNNKIATVIKHIPGHGLAKVDSHKKTPTINKELRYLNNHDFMAFKNKNSLFAMTAHLIYKKIDKVNTATHSKKIIKLIRNKIKFRNILMSDDISMKSLKGSIAINTKKSFTAGCDLVLHCNGDLKEMNDVALYSPVISKFIKKKTSQFYKIIS